MGKGPWKVTPKSAEKLRSFVEPVVPTSYVANLLRACGGLGSR